MSMTPSRNKIEATRLRHLAEEGRGITYFCRSCRNLTNFLASDVVDIWGPEMQVYQPPASCGKCGKSGCMTVRFFIPVRGDMLRRPAGVRTVQLWKDEAY